MKATFVFLAALCLVISSCTSTSNYVPRAAISQIDLDNNFYLKIGFEDAWNVYLESSPQNQFTGQFQKFREAGLEPYFIAISKDGMFGARCLAQTSLLSFADYIPLLRDSVAAQGVQPRNDETFLFKELNAQSWDYDYSDFTFHDVVLKNTNKFYRFSFWTTKANFEKYRAQIELLVQSIDVVHK